LRTEKTPKADGRGILPGFKEKEGSAATFSLVSWERDNATFKARGVRNRSTGLGRGGRPSALKTDGRRAGVVHLGAREGETKIPGFWYVTMKKPVDQKKKIRTLSIDRKKKTVKRRRGRGGRKRTGEEEGKKEQALTGIPSITWSRKRPGGRTKESFDR